jgi:aminoglycoside phosphotransferase (APT) family kinase protein
MAKHRPFVDQPVGDLAAAARLAEIAARRWGIAPVAPLRVGMNALYSGGGLVVRIGRPSAAGELAIDLAERLATLGVPVPRPASSDVVAEGGLVASCWHQVDAVDAPIDWVAVGAIVRRVHELTEAELPAGYPIPSPTGFPWWEFDLVRAELADMIDGRALAGLDAAIERDRDWTEQVRVGTVVCHGDVHPGNVLMTALGPVLLDWDLLCRAHPAWDHAMLLTLAERWGGDPAIYPAFARGYGRSFAGDPAATAFAELRNVAATLMRVRAGRTDPVARGEAERRLQYWRGDPAAPAWQSQ